VISRIQQSKATEDLYVILTNYMHSVAFEWNRVRKELDVGGDLRQINPIPSPGKIKREKRKARKIIRLAALKAGVRVKRRKLK
jgi:hypothetical protein